MYYILWVRVCSLRSPACNAHEPHCHLWPVCLYNSFPQYLTKGTIFEKKKKKKLMKIKSVLIFSTTFVRNISHYKKKWARYDYKCTKVFRQSSRYSCQILMTFEFPQQIFGKCSNIKFHENPSRGSRVVPCGRTEGRTNGQTDTRKLIVFFAILRTRLINLLEEVL
jgi:hypothetical protein